MSHNKQRISGNGTRNCEASKSSAQTLTKDRRRMVRVPKKGGKFQIQHG